MIARLTDRFDFVSNFTSSRQQRRNRPNQRSAGCFQKRAAALKCKPDRCSRRKITEVKPMAWAELSDTRCYYEVLGQGDPLLLVPGLGVTCRTWDAVVPELARHFTLILLDN